MNYFSVKYYTSFEKSLDSSIGRVCNTCKTIPPWQSVHPDDMDFDTGKPTKSCEYSLADETYSVWLFKLKDDRFTNVTNAIKKNIVNYLNLNTTVNTKYYSKKCAKFYTACNEISALGIGN